MAKIDEIKEFIGFLKAIFITAIVIDTSLIAWVFKHFDSESSMKLLLINFKRNKKIKGFIDVFSCISY